MSRNSRIEQKKIGKILRDARLKSGKTQKEISSLLNRHQSYVSKYESGEKRLDLLEAIKICRAIETDISVFIELVDNITKGGKNAAG